MPTKVNIVRFRQTRYYLAYGSIQICCNVRVLVMNSRARRATLVLSLFGFKHARRITRWLHTPSTRISSLWVMVPTTPPTTMPSTRMPTRMPSTDVSEFANRVTNARLGYVHTDGLPFIYAPVGTTCYCTWGDRYWVCRVNAHGGATPWILME